MMTRGREWVAAWMLVLGLQNPCVALAKTWEVTSDTSNAGQRLTNALANAQDGDRIHVQSPGIYVAPPGGWRIRRSIELFGDGPGKAIFQQGPRRNSTVLQPHGPEDPVLVLDLAEVPLHQSLWNVHLHDLQICQTRNVPAPPSPRSNGVFLKITEEKTVVNLRLSRLFVYGMGNDGIHLEGKDGTWDPVNVSVDDCSSVYNTRHGLLALQVNQLNVRGGSYHGNWHKGAQIQSCPAVHIAGTTFESNQKGGTPSDTLAAAQLFIENSGGFQVSGCHFEGFSSKGGSSERAITINSAGGYVGECFFSGNASPPSAGIYIGWGSQSVVVGTNEWCHVEKLVEVADLPTTKSCTVLPQNVSYSSDVGARIVIPDAADRGHLIVVPTNNHSNLTAGLALPRLTKPTRDGMKPLAAGGTLRKGLLIFNETSRKLNYWDGTAWREISDVSSGP